MAHWTDKYSFVFGAPIERELGALVLIDDETADDKFDVSMPVCWKEGEWLRIPESTLDLGICGMTIVQDPVRQIAYQALTGQVFLWGGGEAREETIRTSSGSPADIGMMRSICTIDGKAYSVGMQRQVYRRDGVDSWSDLSRDIRPKTDEDVICSFEGIDGFHPDEIYTCGRDGEIWWYDGTRWNQVNSPTNVILTNIACAPDGFVYVCGRTGLLLKGRRNEWEVVDQDVIERDFWGITWFRDRIYLATMHLITELTEEGLEPVKFEEDFPMSCFSLAVAPDDSVMWSTGAKDLFSFDGETWTRID